MATKSLKGLAKDTAIYGLSSIVGRFLNWLLVPLYTIRFADYEYGILNNIYAYVAFAIVILTFGMETTFFRYMNSKDEDPRTVYSTVLVFVGSICLLFIFSCLSFISPISNALGYEHHKDYLIIMIITVAFDAFTAIPFAYLRFKQRPIRFATFKLLSIFLNIGLNLFFIILCPKIYASHPEYISWFYNPDFRIGYAFVSNLIPSVLLALILLPDYTGFKYKIDFSLLKRMLRYSFPLVILGITGIMNQTVDKILYPIIFENEKEGLAQLGIYSAGAKIAVIMTMFTQAYRFAFEPFIFAKNKANDDKKMYAKAMTYFVLLSLFMFLTVTFYLDILKYFIGSGFFAGIVVVPLVLIGEMFFGIYFNLSLWFKLTDKTIYGAFFSIVGCIIIVSMNVFLVPIYGFIASAWANLACYFAMSMLSYLIGRKYYPIAYELKKLLGYFIFALLLYYVGTYFTIDLLALRLLYRSLLLLLFVVVVVKLDVPLKSIPFLNKYFK